MKKRLLPLLLCLALLLSACGGPASGGSAAAADAPAESIQEPTDSLTVYIGDDTVDDYVHQLRQAFEKSHPDVTLEIITCDLYTDTTEADKLAAELAAGRGPDLYIGAGTEFKDFYKVLNTGVFCDLTPYLENMASFDRPDYVENIFDAGLFRGNLCFLPLTWCYPGFVTTQESLDKAGIDAEALGAYSGLMQAARGFSDTHGGNSAFYGTNIGPYFFECAGVPYLNYETLGASPDTPEFREMIDAYKLIYPQDWTGLEFDWDRIRYGKHAFSLQNEQHIFTNRNWDATTEIGSVAVQFNCLTGRETSLLLPVPTVDGKIDAKVDLLAAISTNSQNKSNAADMIGLLLQKQLQESIAVNSIPVRRETIREQVNRMARHLSNPHRDWVDDDGTFLSTWQNITQEEEDYLVETLCRVDSAHVSILTVLDMVFNDMEPYFNDEQPYEACLQKLQSDLTIYISE